MSDKPYINTVTIDGHDVLFVDGIFDLTNCDGKQYGPEEYETHPLSGLKELDLPRYGIESIKGLEICTEMEVLDLSDNPLGEIPHFPDVFGLKMLVLNGINVVKIRGLDMLKNLQHLEISANNIQKIEGLHELKELRHLFLGENKIEKIKGLNNLNHLQTLSLSHNKIQKIENLNHLKNLKNLYLNHNRITKIEGLENLEKLERLSLNNNKIEAIQGIGNLENLKFLLIEWNRIPWYVVHEELGGYGEHNLINAQLAVKYCKKKEQERP